MDLSFRMDAPADAPLTISDFLNPASMLTPGIAGSLTMMIANTLSAALGWPPSGVGLVLSFILGTLVIAQGISLWSKIVYYVVNSLIIFCMAFGTANIAANAATRDPSAQSTRVSLIGSAYAAEAASGTNAKAAVATPAEISALLDQVLKDAAEAKDPNDPAVLAARARLAKALEEQQRLQTAVGAVEPNAAAHLSGPRPFFQQWKF